MVLRWTWRDVLDSWIAVELDFQDQSIYGIDLDSGILRERSWRWLQTRIVGLITHPDSRLHRVLTAMSTAGKES